MSAACIQVPLVRENATPLAPNAATAPRGAEFSKTFQAEQEAQESCAAPADKDSGAALDSLLAGLAGQRDQEAGQAFPPIDNAEDVDKDASDGQVAATNPIVLSPFVLVDVMSTPRSEKGQPLSEEHSTSHLTHDIDGVLPFLFEAQEPKSQLGDSLPTFLSPGVSDHSKGDLKLPGFAHPDQRPIENAGEPIPEHNPSQNGSTPDQAFSDDSKASDKRAFALHAREALQNPVTPSQTGSSETKNETAASEASAHLTMMVTPTSTTHVSTEHALGAAGAPAATPSSQTDRADLVSQLVDKIQLVIKNHNSELTVSLKPEFLGRITLHASVVDHNLVTTIVTESAAVRKLIESDLPTLQHALRESGLESIKVVVSQETQSNLTDSTAGHSFSHQQNNPAPRQQDSTPNSSAMQQDDVPVQVRPIPAAPGDTRYQSATIHLIA